MEAQRIIQAVMRSFTERGFSCLPEFTLKTNRRPDIVALGKDGVIVMIEVKSSLADFRADQKWHEYGEWADEFYFAVGDDFPIDVLPDAEQAGIIITDGFDCHIMRQAPVKKLAAVRRHHLIKRIARAAMMRHYHLKYSEEA